MKMLEDLAEVVPGELDKTAPEIIWLQIDTSESNKERDELWPGDDGVTWCSESIGGIEIQYVRADLYTDMAKRLEAADALLSKVVTPYYDSAERIQLFKDIQSHMQESGEWTEGVG